MEIKINLDQLLDEQLTINQYIYLYFLYKQQTKDKYESVLSGSVITPVDLEYLIRQEYIREDNSIRAKTLELFEPSIDDFSKFVEVYRDLFPKGVKSGNGTPIRGDKGGVTKKMEWFLRSYPEYNQNIILEATTQYVREMQRKIPQYAYMSQADYFIQKDGASKLASYCEEYVNKVLPHIATGERRL